jgi:drug/metabolite transporter (DMT)-like permease
VHWLALAMALFSTVLPIWLSTQALRRIGASRTAIVSSAGPIVTMSLAWLVLGEPVSVSMLAGAALVILGVRLIATRPMVHS